MLTRTWTVTLSAAVGFDPYRGFYHQPRYGRPALALDLMEPFRPLIADSAVIQAINNAEVQANDFLRAGQAVALKPDGGKRFIAAFERRLSQEITHSLFGYRITYRRLMEVQARLLGRWLLGEVPRVSAVHHPLNRFILARKAGEGRGYSLSLLEAARCEERLYIVICDIASRSAGVGSSS